MEKFGLTGYPIAHSQSPALFAEAYGGQWEYDLIEEETFERAFGRFVEGPYRAVNVTAPFKTEAYLKADIRSAGCEKTRAANILVKTPEGIAAHNSDYLAVKSILRDCAAADVAVIGCGGAGRAAIGAAEDLGLSVRSFHHDEIASGVRSDVIIYTLPSAVEGIDKLDCRILLEANYKDPCLGSHPGYVPGTEWLRRQAALGFPLMTGRAINFFPADSVK